MQLPSIVQESFKEDVISADMKPSFHQEFMLASISGAEFKFGFVWW